ncbi:unnamed protein product [Caenorhabditis nigoni]
MSIYNNLYSRRAPGFTPLPEKGYALHTIAITAKNLEESLLLFVVVMLENNELKWRNIRRNTFVQESGTENQQLNMVDMSSEEGLIFENSIESKNGRGIRGRRWSLSKKE